MSYNIKGTNDEHLAKMLDLMQYFEQNEDTNTTAKNLTHKKVEPLIMSKNRNKDTKSRKDKYLPGYQTDKEQTAQSLFDKLERNSKLRDPKDRITQDNKILKELKTLFKNVPDVTDTNPKDIENSKQKQGHPKNKFS